MGEAPTIAVRPRLKTVEKNIFGPTYAGANVGHPDRVVHPASMIESGGPVLGTVRIIDSVDGNALQT